MVKLEELKSRKKKLKRVAIDSRIGHEERMRENGLGFIIREEAMAIKWGHRTYQTQY